jgi:hypothetical protein
MFHAGANAGNKSSGENIVIMLRYLFSRLSQHLVTRINANRLIGVSR